MKIIPRETTDKDVQRLFAEHDDFMIAFLGNDREYYTRYSEGEKIEKAWVAYCNDSAVGCIAYREKNGETGEVKRMYIKNEYRGKGISKELLKTVESHAKKQGCHTLFLDTRINLEPAVSIYYSWGFDMVFQQGLYIQMEKYI